MWTNIFPKVLLLLLFLPVKVLADEPLLILTEQLFPLNYTANGEDDEVILGFATELVHAVMAESKIDYEINMVPWARAVNSINNNPNILVYSMARSPVREKKYHWIGEIWFAKFNLYGHRDRLTKLPLSAEDIKKLRIGTTRGSVTRGFLADHGFSNIVTIKTMESYMRLLERDRIDLFPFTDFSVYMAASRQGFDHQKLVSVMEFTELPLRMSLAASKSMDEKTVKRLKTAFNKVKISGRFDEIIAPLQEMIEEFN